jgi:hypothetical protein
MEKDNPFCENCREKDCMVSLEGTCAMIRKYLLATNAGNHIIDLLSEAKNLICTCGLDNGKGVDLIKRINDCIAIQFVDANKMVKYVITRRGR